ncbi:MAG TPA: hypothetical protein VMU68_02535 [Acidimicrobiales bacterium]|nr:hypothetical protein [Acidimicrobiales bacterium]
MTLSPARKEHSAEVSDPAELLIKEAQRASRRRRLRNGLFLLLALLLVVGVTTYQADRGGPATPRIGTDASTAATPPNSTSLFSVSRILTLATDGAGPFIVGAGNDSIFVEGTFDQLKGQTSNSKVDDLIRIDLRTWRISDAARYPNETSVAFGDGALWWATGQNAFDIPAPDSGRVLFKIDPTNLSKEKAFVLPDRTLLVTVAGTSLWVATPNVLIRLDPVSGRILVNDPSSFFPIAMSSSDQGKYLDVLGSRDSKEYLTTYDAVSGRRMMRRLIPGASGGPLATTTQGVWVNTDNVKSQSTTVRYYEGDRLIPSAARRGYPPDISLFSGVGVIWLVDSWGLKSTECLAPSTGQVRSRGSPLGVYGSFVTYAGRTFMLFDRGLTDYLARVIPTESCS